jgi:hypothetical protein
MKEHDIKEYFLKADDHYYTAMNLYAMYITDNFPYHRFDPLSKIANNCELAGELNIKAYMGENKIAFEKTHSLMTFFGRCADQNEYFLKLESDVSLLAGYTSKTNYPNEIHIDKGIVKRTIESAQNILFFEEILKLRYKYGVQLPVTDEEIKDKMIRDEEAAYIMALEVYRGKLGINVSGKNIAKIKAYLKDNRSTLPQTIEIKKREILQNDKKFGSYRILLEAKPGILGELEDNQADHVKSISRKKHNKKTDNDIDIGR